MQKDFNIFKIKIVSGSVKDTLNIGKKIAQNLKSGDIICLFGQLGSGKTVLTKGIASGLGIKKERVVSPSFVLLRQYRRAKLPFYHFDLYRLKTLRDILGLGYEEYFYGDGVTVIEWADRLRHFLPRKFLKIQLLIQGSQKRLFQFTAQGRHYKELLQKLYEYLKH